MPEDKEGFNDGDLWENTECQGKRMRRSSGRTRGGAGNAFGARLTVLGPDTGRRTGEWEAAQRVGRKTKLRPEVSILRQRASMLY